MRQLKLTGRLEIFNRYIPDIWLVSISEAEKAKEAGLTFIITEESPDRIFLIMLVHWLAKNLSAKIRWSDIARKELGISEAEEFTGIWYPDPEYNSAGGGNVPPSAYCQLRGPAAAGRKIDMGSYVNIETLFKARLMPHFFLTLAQSIGTDWANWLYQEGYNKKHDLCSGGWVPAQVRRNLIIIDVSRSIPIGIADMMLHAMANMSYKFNADVIVTGGRSYFWKKEEAAVLSPKKVRAMVPRANEGEMFCAILKQRLAGKHYENVVSFGDNDSFYNVEAREELTVRVGNVYHYHTQHEKSTGYGLWADEIAEGKITVHDTSWCHMLRT